MINRALILQCIALFEPREFLLVDPHDHNDAPDLEVFPFDTTTSARPITLRQPEK